MEAVTAKLSPSAEPRSTISQSVYHIISSVIELFFDLKGIAWFDSWYKRYEDLFTVDLSE